jgi:hypothetical protein
VVAIVWGIACGIVGYSFTAGREYQSVKQKLEQNDKEHSEIKADSKSDYAKLDAKLDVVNTKLSKIDGKVDVLLGQRSVDTEHGQEHQMLAESSQKLASER